MKLRQLTKLAVRKTLATSKAFVQEGTYRKVAQSYNIKGYKRVYLVHIRKTGGTSLHNMFLSLSGEDPNVLYKRLLRAPDYRLISNGLIYAGWNIDHINKGNYFYAFSHAPLHKLSLPEKTFTVSCFRDPVKRVISHYSMLMGYRENNFDHPCMKSEGTWLGNNFRDFLMRIPKQHLLNQIYTFSDRFDIEEAVSNTRHLSHYFFTDAFEEGVRELSRKTELPLEPMHVRAAGYRAHIPDDALSELRERLDPEYQFLDAIRESKEDG